MSLEKIKIDTDNETINPKDNNIFQILYNRGLWSNFNEIWNYLDKKHERWDYLVITYWSNNIVTKIHLEDKYWREKSFIKEDSKAHREDLDKETYNDGLMNFNWILTEYQIKNLFLRHWKYEQRIENLKGEVLKYFRNKISSKINLGWDWYLSYVDRWLQRNFLIKFNNNRLKIVWYSKVTTWNPKKWHYDKYWRFVQWYDKNWSKYWETPCVIIRMPNTIWKWKWKSDPKEWVDIWWYWKRGSRIFWLWNLKYNIKTKLFEFTTKNDKDIWFASHKTSIPGEKNLWEPYINTRNIWSHWCIRNEHLMDDVCANIEKWEAIKREQIFQYTIIWDYKRGIVPYIPKLKH